MARDRQRAKRRQAERRAARLRDERSSRGVRARPDGDGGERRATAPPAGAGGSAGPEPDPAAEAQIAAAAPPEETGRSDTVVEAPPDAPSLATDGAATARDRERGAEAGERQRGRVAAFLAAVVAELQRVQWPNRRTLVTLTGVVLGFVIVMGAYLGGLDWVFSQLVQALL